MKRLSFTMAAALLVASFAQITVAQSKTVAMALSNEDIVSMVKAGLSSDIITAKIQKSACDFDTSPAALEKLKSAGVPNSVILAMVKNPGSSATEAKPKAVLPESAPKRGYQKSPLHAARSVPVQAGNRKPVLLLIGNGTQNRHGKIDKHWLKEFSKAIGCFETVTDSGAPHNYELIVTEQKKSAFMTIMGNQQPTFEATLTGPKGKYIGSQTISPKLIGHNHFPWSRARAFAETEICNSGVPEAQSIQKAL